MTEHNDSVMVSRELLRQALQAHRAMREWIRAVPEPLISMPGVDGDWLDSVKGMLCTALEQPVQEPVAWVYQNANTDNEYLVWKKGTGGRNWKPLFAAPQQPAVEPEVDYRAMYLKVRDELADAQQRLDTCEALARSVMNDQVGRA